MKFKSGFLIVCMIICLFSIASVCAGDVEDTTVASEDAGQMELSSNSAITDDNLQTSEDNAVLAQENDDESVSAQTDPEILGDSEGTYSDLRADINNGGNLTKSYYRYHDGDGNTIEITTPDMVINGNGAVIDMEGSNIRAFYVSVSGATFKNLTIKNANYTGNGGAIYLPNKGTVTNCNFINNSAAGYGGAVYFTLQGTVTNCNFTNNKATDNNEGGAIYMTFGNVENCNFINNTADYFGGAVNFDGTGNVRNCNFTNNAARYGGAIRIIDGDVSNCNFVNNTAAYGYGGAVYLASTGQVMECNFVNNTATDGGAIYTDNYVQIGFATADTCIFKTDSDSTYQVNIYPPTLNVDNFTTFYNSGEKLKFEFKTKRGWYVENGNISISVYNKNNDSWVGNYSCLSNEGWIVDLPVGQYYATFNTEYAKFKPINRTITIVPNTTFWALNHTINANDTSEVTLTNDYYFDPAYDGAFANGIVINRKITLTGNSYTIDAKGQARAFNVQASDVTIENLTIKNANANDEGGAIYFSQSGRVINCNFTDNHAEYYGGAVYFQSTSTVTNCNFTNNSAMYGGAIRFSSMGAVTNCIFTNNTATYESGAIKFSGSNTVTNCNFTDNQAGIWGGAIRFDDKGTVTNCNFTNNTAGHDGGAIHMNFGSVENCNFTGNNATAGSAICFYSTSLTKTVSNSCFLNNRANAGALEVTKNENNITITFTGGNNLLNAIYSQGDVTFTNVTYWGVNGIANTGSSPTTPSRSNKAAGQNITVGVVVNDELILNEVKVTDENGTIVLNINAGDNYYITAFHDTDSYYTEAEKTISNNTKFNVNVTSQTTTNKTVNITAKSNIYSEFMQGKLLFILPNGVEINATYASDGIWWAEYTFDDYADYQVNASYNGLDNVTINNATISIVKANSTVEVSDVILNYGESKDVTATTEGAIGITAKIDGKGATVKGNTIMIPVLDAGTHTLTVTTIPDENHTAVTKTAKITIKKLKTTLTANAKVFKFEDKTKKYAVALKDIKGRIMKNTKVTLKVNGVTYTATTNAKGVATFTLKKLTKKGSFNAVISYAGDKNHIKTTKTVKITVKAPAFKTVSYGSKDKNTVKKIQVALKKNGFYIKAYGRYLKVDGIYHGYTQNAVKQFQKAKKLKVTGKVDYTTAKKLKII